MLTITVSGASDDLVEFEGHISDEFTVLPNDHWTGDLVAPNGEQLRVHAHYDGCWSVGVGQTDEDIPLPPWSLSLAQHRSTDYSTALTIEAPDGTELLNISE